MDSQERKDALDSLLDSMTMDNTMERKINEFSKNKERKKRIQRARETSAQFQETYSSTSRQIQEKEKAASFESLPGFARKNSNSQEDTSEQIAATQPIRGNADMEAVCSASASGDTMVFAGEARTASSEEHPQTVIMNPNEIQNLYEEDRSLLKREYISEKEEKSVSFSAKKQTSEKRQKSFINWKLSVYIIAGVLVLAAVFGCWQFFSSWNDQRENQAEKSREEYYEKILEWAEKYDSLSEDEQKEITSLESMFNKLDASRQMKINEVLLAATGKNFNELLAAAKTSSKLPSGNNNTEIAEKKAALKQEITDLQSQLSQKKSELSSKQQEINEAYSEYTAANNDYITALNAYNKAVEEYNSYNSQLQTLQSQAAEMKSSRQDLQSRLEALEQGSQEEDTSEEAAQLRAQIEDLDSSIASNAQEQSGTVSKRTAAESQMSEAQQTLSKAQQSLNEAQQSYTDLEGTDQSIQSEITELENQISALQEQLGSLN